jgi:hypothetical protein
LINYRVTYFRERDGLSAIALGDSEGVDIVKFDDNDVEFNSSKRRDSYSSAASSSKKAKCDLGHAILSLGDSMKEGLMSLTKPSESESNADILKELKAMNEAAAADRAIQQANQEMNQSVNLQILKALQALKK